MPPDLQLESEYPHLIVAGIDEVGRGPLAGPLVTSVVILDQANIPSGINDSKQLSAKKRQALFELINLNAQVAIGIASIQEIDELGLTAATNLAMLRAYKGLAHKPDIALIDGNIAYKLPCPVKTVVKGDSFSLSIAASSIIAKVTRDLIMTELSNDFPEYGWEKNVGYGTKQHLEAMLAHGITPHHRKSFAPVAKLIATGGRLSHY